MCLTYPLIGNYGVNEDDPESRQPWTRGLIVRELAARHSNWRATGDLGSYLVKHGIVGIDEVDTRALTRHLRLHGAKTGVISTVDLDAGSLVRKARAAPKLGELDLVRGVTTEAIAPLRLPSGSHDPLAGQPAAGAHHVVAIDAGAKHNIMRHLAARGCRVTVAPATASAEEISALEPDGLFLSNGPGDPEQAPYLAATVRGLLDAHRDLPVFGICLGLQIMSLALDAAILQAQVRPPRRQPPGARGTHRRYLHHQPEPRLRGGCRLPARAPAHYPRQPQRRHHRGRRAPFAAGVRHPVPPGSGARPARRPIPVRPLRRRHGGVSVTTASTYDYGGTKGKRKEVERFALDVLVLRSGMQRQPRLRSLSRSTSPPSRMALSAYMARSAIERWLGVGSGTATFDCIACGIWAATCVMAAIVEAPDGDSAYSSQPLRLSRSVFSDASRTGESRWFRSANISAISRTPVWSIIAPSA